MTLAEFLALNPACFCETLPSGGKFMIPTWENGATLRDLFHLSDYAVSSSTSGPGFYLIPRAREAMRKENPDPINELISRVASSVHATASRVLSYSAREGGVSMAHKHFFNHEDNCFVGTCPACSEPVLWDDPDGPVWTCPADLAETNPFWVPANARITDELRESSGVFSNCGEDFGFGCYERMPLHSACYEKGNY